MSNGAVGEEQDSTLIHLGKPSCCSACDSFCSSTWKRKMLSLLIPKHRSQLMLNGRCTAAGLSLELEKDRSEVRHRVQLYGRDSGVNQGLDLCVEVLGQKPWAMMIGLFWEKLKNGFCIQAATSAALAH